MNSTVDLAFAGDFAPTHAYGSAALVASALRNVRSYVGRKAVLFLNLECTVWHETLPDVLLPCNADILRALRAENPLVLNLANNHFFDAGVESYGAVRERLSELNVRAVGLYGKGSERSADVLNFDGCRIGVISRVARGTNPTSFGNGQWSIRPLERTELLDACRSLREHVDVLVVSLHWGAEFYTVPSPWQRDLVRELLTAGVDVVWGHHAHILQPRGRQGKQLVMYNLGNFLFGAEEAGCWPLKLRKSVIVKARRTPEGFECREMPIYAEEDGALRLAETDREVRVSPRIGSRVGLSDYAMWCLRRLYTELIEAGSRRVTRQRYEKVVAGKIAENTPRKLASSIFRRLVRALDLKVDE